MGKIPKPEVLNRVARIGVDEYNNGHSNRHMPEIYVSYAIYPHENPLRTMQDRLGKGGGFDRNPGKRSGWMGRANQFVRRNYRFRWCTVDRTEDSVQRFHRKTLAIARLVLESSLDLNYGFVNDFVVVVDGAQFGAGRGEDPDLWSKQVIERRLKEYGIKKDVHFRPRGDKGEKHPELYVADRLANIIGAKRFGHVRGRWPFSERRVNLAELPRLDGQDILDIESILEKGCRGRH